MVESLLDFLRFKGVEFCVLRNYEYLPYSTGESDLDILFFNYELKSVNHLVQEYCVKQEVKLISYIPSNDAPKYCLIDRNGQGLQMDVFLGGIRRYKQEILPVQIIKDFTINHEKFDYLDGRIAEMLTFLKEFYFNKVLSDEIVVLANEIFVSDFIQYVINGIYEDGLLEHLCKTAPELSRVKLLEIHRTYIRRRSYTSGVVMRIKRFRNPPGKMVAFLGTDGSGKSTIISRVTPLLNMVFHGNIVRKHLKPSVLPRLGSLRRNSQEDTCLPHENRVSSLPLSYFKFVYSLADYLLGYLLKEWFIMNTKSCILIYDRYFYDYLIDQRRFGISINPKFIRFCEKLVKKPDIVICLGGGTDEIYNRKKELSYGETERQIGILKEMTNSRANFYWVDSTKSIEETLVEVHNCLYVGLKHIELS